MPNSTMLLSLLGYGVFGLLLFVPLRWLLRWLRHQLGPRIGLAATGLHYVRPYVPLAQRKE